MSALHQPCTRADQGTLPYGHLNNGSTNPIIQTTQLNVANVQASIGDMANTKGRRGFDEITVSNASCQPGTERYCEPWEELTAPPLAEDNLQPPQFGSTIPGAPYISPWRSNLVALSQRFNVSTGFGIGRSASSHSSCPRSL